MTSTEQNIVTSETSVWDKCHKCNINCHIAVHARVLSPSTLPHWISTDTQPFRCQNGLLARSHKDLEHTHHPSFNTHTKLCSLKLQQTLCISHCAICIVVCDAAVPSVV